MPTSMIEARIDDTDAVIDVVNILKCLGEGYNGDPIDFDLCMELLGYLQKLVEAEEAVPEV